MYNMYKCYLICGEDNLMVEGRISLWTSIKYVTAQVVFNDVIFYKCKYEVLIASMC